MSNAVKAIYRRIEIFCLERAAIRPLRAVALMFTWIDLRDEARAVLQGRMRSRNGDVASTITQFRRDIHRLEKGIIMRPRRAVFGKDYVLEALSRFARLEAEGKLPDEERIWATDVFSQYFALVVGSGEDWVHIAHERFLEVSQVNLNPLAVPAAREETPPLKVSIEELDALSVRRRSVRWFLPDNVPQDDLKKAIRVAGMAPSACNRQNIRFEFFSGTTQAQEILDCAGGTRGFSQQVPCAGVLIGKLGGYRHTFDRHAIYIDGGLATMGFLYALETLGLSSCCINWPDVPMQNNSIRKLVQLDDDEVVLMLVAIGYADPSGLVPHSRKRSTENFSAFSTIGPKTSASVVEAEYQEGSR